MVSSKKVWGGIFVGGGWLFWGVGGGLAIAKCGSIGTTVYMLRKLDGIFRLQPFIQQILIEDTSHFK